METPAWICDRWMFLGERCRDWVSRQGGKTWEVNNLLFWHRQDTSTRCNPRVGVGVRQDHRGLLVTATGSIGVQNLGDIGPRLPWSS